MVVQLNINALIPEDRKVILQLPADTPTGNVKMQLTISDQNEPEPTAIPDFIPWPIPKSGLVREIKGSRKP